MALGLVVEELCFTPRDSDVQWGPMSFEVDPGDTVGLCGASGSGKSLLLRSIVDLDEHSGRVYLKGREQGNLPAPAWRRNVGMLPAETAWWFDSVGEHFSDEVPPSILEALGFHQDSMEWSVSRLSAGEKQRLALARLLALKPDALLLDEPTANLDAESVSMVEQVIGSYREENACPVVWVAHSRDQLSRVATCVYEMRDRSLHLLES